MEANVAHKFQELRLVLDLRLLMFAACAFADVSAHLHRQGGAQLRHVASSQFLMTSVASRSIQWPKRAAELHTDESHIILWCGRTRLRQLGPFIVHMTKEHSIALNFSATTNYTQGTVFLALISSRFCIEHSHTNAGK